MKKKKKVLILIVFQIFASFLLISFPVNSQSPLGVNNSIGDYVAYDINLRLSGSTGDYYDWSEKEDDDRIYTITEISGDEINWKMERDWRYNDDDYDKEYDESTYFFKTNQTDFSYLDGTHDGPDEDLPYYTYDNIWFRIDPSSKINDIIHILGYNYIVEDISANILHKGKYVECIQISTLSSYLKVVDDPKHEYDVDGQFEYNFEETMYFDINTGYLVKSKWKADARTSEGNFVWRETIKLTDASFTIPMSAYGKKVILSVSLISILVIAFIILFDYFKCKSTVETTIRLLNNDLEVIKAPKSKIGRYINSLTKYHLYSYDKVIDEAPSLWNPSSLNYQSLLEEWDAPEKYHLNDGVFIIIDPYNKLGIVDVSNNRLFTPKLMPINEDSIKILFKLALTMQPTIKSPQIEDMEAETLDTGYKEINTDNRYAREIQILCSTTRDWKLYAKAFGWGRAHMGFREHVYSLDYNDIVQQKYTLESKSIPITTDKGIYHFKIENFVSKDSGFALSDEFLLDRSSEHYSSKEFWEEYHEIDLLLSRRKVIDYTLGQAPLTPYSHYRKLTYILRSNPKKVLLVGDDDLISVSLARRGIEVHTLELDPYTCALISGISRNENLPITIYQTDLRNPLPENLPDNFDIFVADPDFTILAYGLFLCRGMSKLNNLGIGIINFEGGFGNHKLIKRLLKQLNIPIIHFSKEKWTYVSIHNQTSRIIDSMYRSGYGKYSHVSYNYHYKHEIVYDKAPYKSHMYILQKRANSIIPLDKDEFLRAPEKYIYDY